MKKNWIISLSLLSVLVVWLVSGVFVEKEVSSDEAEAERSEFKVQIESVIAEEIEQKVVFSGRTEPDRRVTLKAEIEGRVLDVEAKRGALMSEGDVVLMIDPRDLPNKMEEAGALVAQRELEYEASKRLREKGLASEAQLAGAKSAIEQARALLASIKIDMANSEVRAPFRGKLQDRLVEVGDYVKKGDELGVFIEADPMVARGQVSEDRVGSLSVGMTGLAFMRDGKQLEGFVKYISPESDARTRTFNIELKLRNIDSLEYLGKTAQVVIPVGKRWAHKIAPSHLSLDEAGQLGVKYIDEEDVVHFGLVNLVESSKDSVWVDGLPKYIRLITFGQGFVVPGQKITSLLTGKKEVLGDE